MMIMKIEKLKWLSDQKRSPRRVVDSSLYRSQTQESSTLAIRFPEYPTLILLKDLQGEYDKNALCEIFKE